MPIVGGQHSPADFRCRRCHGKVALITASTNGIGFAIARRLLAEGATVVISSRRQSNVDEALRSLREQGLTRVTGLTCHVAARSQRDALVRHVLSTHGRLDMLVLNAAVSVALAPTVDVTEAEWTKLIHVNLISAALLVKEASPLLAPGAAIVFVSSIAGLAPIPLLGAYSATKTALLGLVKALAAELSSRDLRVNCVAPGIVETKFSHALYDDPARLRGVLAQIPMGRLGQPHEVASVVAFCLSDDASYMTGETLVVAGGMQSRL